MKGIALFIDTDTFRRAVRDLRQAERDHPMLPGDRSDTLRFVNGESRLTPVELAEAHVRETFDAMVSDLADLLERRSVAAADRGDSPDKVYVRRARTQVSDYVLGTHGADVAELATSTRQTWASRVDGSLSRPDSVGSILRGAIKAARWESEHPHQGRTLLPGSNAGGRPG
ncbi:hypothetical protein [Parafrankia sp. BMG5.11]|uniref:hypothetical protein n=1 Tax=Parafrankia sp. BMG5.11 TaxID=222540 RepID=UPI00103D1FA4|nr:hypothetical protein [Parafrankia sp. BMG5.11]TCJ40711.1 hypothetical protein E0504_03795 [Parafrankia sp. BMG5.11]